MFKHSAVKSLALLTAALTAALSLQQASLACTGIRLTAKDGAVVTGRTLEFGVDLKSRVAIYPRGTAFSGSLSGGMKGVAFKSRYGIVGADGLGLPAIIDGLNDQGLYAGIFFFPGYATFTPVTAENASHSLANYQYTLWILANFATVAEVKAAFNTVSLAATPVEALGGPAPAHFRVVDRTGAAVVIEQLNGTLKLFDDPLGVITNSPSFDWHITNLGNYIGLSPDIRPSITIDGQKISGFGQGSGFFGLPGDFTPPSRFVRAVAFEQTAVQPNTGADAVQQVFHILNNFDIPVGSVRDEVNGRRVDEWTTWMSVDDLQNLVFAYRTYSDQTLRSVDVRKALASAGTSPRYVPMESNQVTPIANMTP
jgi:choloylglycine hydrolase